MTDRNRQRLAELMKARKEELGRTWVEVAELGGLTDETLRQVRYGTGEIRRGTRRGIDIGLDWVVGEGVNKILAGGEPVPAASRQSATDGASRETQASVMRATPEKLAEMYQLVEEEFGPEEADRFLRRVIELRRQSARRDERAAGAGEEAAG